MGPRSITIVRVESHVTRAQRRAELGHAGATVWFTGLSGSGGSTLAYAVGDARLDRALAAYVLDGDDIRHGLDRDLGFSPEGRAENSVASGSCAGCSATPGPSRSRPSSPPTVVIGTRCARSVPTGSHSSTPGRSSTETDGMGT